MIPTGWCRIATVIALSFAAATPSLAQVDLYSAMPDGKWGVGFETRGAHLQYALMPQIHLGFTLNLHRRPDPCFESETLFDYQIGYYARYMFPGYLMTPLVVAGYDQHPPNQPSCESHPRDEDPPEYIYLALGVGHFFNRNVGLYGQVRVIDVRLVPPPAPIFHVGLMGGTAGVEFFF